MSWSLLADRELENDAVLLRPVTEPDREPLREIAFDEAIWRYFVSRVDTTEDFEALVDGMLADKAAGTRMPFCIVDKATGRVAGSSSYNLVSERDLRVEIGWSWVGTKFLGRGGGTASTINRNTKHLLLQHAFEVLGALRVEFKTDELNQQARRGLVRIGAIEEGTLRSFNTMPDGRRRNAVFYSVLADEWPSVDTHLGGGLVAAAPRGR